MICCKASFLIKHYKGANELSNFSIVTDEDKLWTLPFYQGNAVQVLACVVSDSDWTSTFSRATFFMLNIVSYLYSFSTSLCYYTISFAKQLWNKHGLQNSPHHLIQNSAIYMTSFLTIPGLFMAVHETTSLAKNHPSKQTQVLPVVPRNSVGAWRWYTMIRTSVWYAKPMSGMCVCERER